ncbi:hypothetical protein BDZ89DRAFT_153591 [Hymenopellis radicata]|nr:hypothetical protein BDZ89DRAFT_153591 [Hymenopellis radicata]
MTSIISTIAGTVAIRATRIGVWLMWRRRQSTHWCRLYRCRFVPSYCMAGSDRCDRRPGAFSDVFFFRGETASWLATLARCGPCTTTGVSSTILVRRGLCTIAGVSSTILVRRGLCTMAGVSSTILVRRGLCTMAGVSSTILVRRGLCTMAGVSSTILVRRGFCTMS